MPLRGSWRMCALLCVVAIPCVASSIHDDEEGGFATSTPASQPAQAHEYIVSTGFAPVDRFVLHPPQYAALYARLSVRGAIQALRDVLFSHIKDEGAHISPVDGIMPDERPEDFAYRLRVRDWWTAQARQYHLFEYAQTHPQTLRYGLAAAAGVVLMLFLVTMQACAGLTARLCMRFLFWYTGDETVLDHDDRSARALQAKLEARVAAQRAADAAKKQS